MPYKVLVIDDEPLFITFCRRVLEKGGTFCVAGATTVEEAQQVLRTCPKEIVLVDLLLDQINGFQLIPILKRFSPNSTFVLISDTPQPSLDALAKQAGAVGFLEKKALTPQRLAQLL